VAPGPTTIGPPPPPPKPSAADTEGTKDKRVIFDKNGSPAGRMVDEGFKGYFHKNTVILFLSNENT
jgi:hypothetical protein